MKSKVDLKNNLGIAGLRNSVSFITEIWKTGESNIWRILSTSLDFIHVRCSQSITKASLQPSTKMPGSSLHFF